MLRVLALAAAIAAPASSPLATIDAHLSALARHDEFSGVVLIAKDGRPVFQRAYGFADRARQVRNRVDTKFNLASIGKVFTAVAVAQLVEQGKVSFGDAIGRYVPELPPAVGKRITIAELLDHTSGLGDFFAHPRYPALQHTLTSL